jgi:hypothetical protein
MNFITIFFCLVSFFSRAFAQEVSQEVLDIQQFQEQFVALSNNINSFAPELDAIAPGNLRTEGSNYASGFYYLNKYSGTTCNGTYYQTQGFPLNTCIYLGSGTTSFTLACNGSKF